MIKHQRRILLADELKKGTRISFGGRLYTISKKPKNNDYGEIVLHLRPFIGARHTILIVLPSNTELTVMVPKK